MPVASTSPRSLLSSYWNNRGLLLALTKREVIGRYKGSLLGILWSLFNPILMLTVYTFFFSTVFKARWPGGSESKTEFALVLFSGLLIFNFFAECLGRAPTLVLGNPNYVKKVVFPLETLPFVLVGAAGFHFIASLVVWLLFYLVFFGIPAIQVLYLPLILIPLVLLTLGFSWILASLGVYLRDVNQVVTAVIPALMLLSPVFYPISALPEQMHVIFQLNPMTFLIEQTRGILIWKQHVQWDHWLVQTLASAVFAWIGYAWFQKTRKGFADVL
ncbi:MULTISPECIES: ABC transporter permease [Pseudomonas]|uniref:ABC transporter permease n=1 Tax=Pseudomonas TaxID=286 RepID=UPI001E33F13C|nr:MULTISPECIES: ABC transporter permease [Pseudomonas]MCE4068985.1 ABC transporter permease [Pseudomonas nitritireducens]MCE4078174.1 ABC transporter permease [Pseudomonas nitroreducens]